MQSTSRPSGSSFDAAPARRGSSGIPLSILASLGAAFVAFLAAAVWWYWENRPYYGPGRTSAELATTPTAETLRDALYVYVAQNGLRFPRDLERLLDARPEGMPYLMGGAVPRDAFGGPYEVRVERKDVDERFELWSLGNDGAPGGIGDAADVCELRMRAHRGSEMMPLTPPLHDHTVKP